MKGEKGLSFYLISSTDFKPIIIVNKKMKAEKYQANLGIGNPTFFKYMNMYNHAFDILYDSIDNGIHNADWISYPMLFLASHSLELGLKANIKYFAKYSNMDPLPHSHSHDLERLFNQFKVSVSTAIGNIESTSGWKIEKEDKKEFSKYCFQLEILIKKFKTLDLKSFGFRYPVDKTGMPVFEHVEPINMIEVKTILDSGMTLLNFTADVFAKYTDYIDEMERIMREDYESSFMAYL